jgi:hypothetical protein
MVVDGNSVEAQGLNSFISGNFYQIDFMASILRLDIQALEYHSTARPKLTAFIERNLPHTRINFPPVSVLPNTLQRDFRAMLHMLVTGQLRVRLRTVPYNLRQA